MGRGAPHQAEEGHRQARPITSPAGTEPSTSRASHATPCRWTLLFGSGEPARRHLADPSGWSGDPPHRTGEFAAEHVGGDGYQLACRGLNFAASRVVQGVQPNTPRALVDGRKRFGDDLILSDGDECVSNIVLGFCARVLAALDLDFLVRSPQLGEVVAHGGLLVRGQVIQKDLDARRRCRGGPTSSRSRASADREMPRSCRVRCRPA